MTKLILIGLLALQASWERLERLRWVPNPRATNGTWVSDPSRHLAPATIATLNAEIGALERETGAEIAVVVIDSTSGLDPFSAALGLHRVWGVGKKDYDNGVLFLWVPTQREIFITVGLGLEGVLPDGRVGRIRDQQIFPAFKRGEFDEGVLAGVRALASAVREEKNPVKGRTPLASRPPEVREAMERERQGVSPLVGGGILAGAALTGALGIVAVRRRRRRLCPAGHGPMRLLSESEDDTRLERAERLEEELGSMNHVVWMCGVCGETLHEPRKRWFTSYEKCPSCQRRTVKVDRTTLVAATEEREGRVRVRRTCRNCRWKKETEERTPRLTPSSSGSSSFSSGGGGGGGGGGSSFGGGSSGGGGAGGRY